MHSLIPADEACLEREDTSQSMTVGLTWVMLPDAMKLEQVRRIVNAHHEELSELGVESLMVFGSVARLEERSDSDVDMLVEFSRPTGLFGLIRLKQFLEDQFGCQVDLGTQDSLHPRIREAALAEAVRVA